MASVTHDVRNNPVRDQLAILVPVFTVLLSTRLIIPDLSVQEKHDEESQVPISDRRVESGRQGPGETTSVSSTFEESKLSSRHEPIPEVIGVSGDSPPTRSKKLCSSFSRHPREVCSLVDLSNVYASES